MPQLQRSPAATRIPARDRIGHLERTVASLVTLVRTKSHAPPPSGTRPSGNGGGGAFSNDLGDELERPEVDETTPPSHLRLLFDDFKAGPQDHEDIDGDRRSMRLVKSSIDMARVQLQPLLPSREDVLQIAKYASDWMTLYHTLFPAFFAFHTGDGLIVHYDRMHNDDVDPVTLAVYLLSLAITAQQVPPNTIPTQFHGGQGVPRFVDAVCRAVEHTIVGNDALAGSVEGLEAAMLYVRVSLGRASLRSTWLTLRRIIALAELAGLPHANDEAGHATEAQGNSSRQTQPAQEILKQKADVWEAICATDRNFSMMLNLPPGTARYRFPRTQSISRDGQISPQAYNYQLSNICAAIFEIDESYTRGVPHMESYEMVLNADHQLRALASSAPKAWWQQSADGLSLACLLVKFWHHYTMARIHLRPSMMHVDDQYAYSRTACREACQNAVRCFPDFRSRVPSGFFVCRVLDVQAFTAATFLLLSSRMPQKEGEMSQPPGPHTVDSQTTDMVQRVVDCLASVSDQAGSDLAREARAALASLLTLVRGQQPLRSKPLTLQIPLLGKIHIRGPSGRFASQETPVDPGTMTGSAALDAIGTSPTEPLGFEAAPGWGHHGVEAEDEASTVAPPVPWSFEFDFDTAAFWTQEGFPSDITMNTNGWIGAVADDAEM
ncbi:hypothetical protein LTR36_011008 [Oleoguttula mirabilis]|uniref:Transcription factor domain-containing protein n=1 Tax=Oleoguttula mirabilis TaxID=1507867 RepID=A0AAV9J512_9PEZI|nr:hypothetical protein LTR36_011008 [Oleoguttula mirabilis]